MEISVEKITDIELIKKAISFCYGIESVMTLEKAYKHFHTPVRMQLFAVYMQGIPTKASVHLTRHSQTGQFHLVGSNRADWNGAKDNRSKDSRDISINRLTPVNHFMLLNAQHLTDMSHQRLCHDAELSTRRVWESVKVEVAKIDPDLAIRMVPICEYRNGVCESTKPCGYNLTLQETC